MTPEVTATAWLWLMGEDQAQPSQRAARRRSGRRQQGPSGQFETERRSVSYCPDGPCCRRPDPRLAARWDGWSWASPTSHSHAIAAAPSGIPGTDTAAVYQFLERYSPEG